MPRGEVIPHKGPPSNALELSYDRVDNLSQDLSTRIQLSGAERKEEFDLMMIIPRGSFYVANILARELEFTGPEIYQAAISSYKQGETVRSKEFIYGQMPLIESVKGKNILIIEEVCDTGQTLTHLFDLLEFAGAGLVRAGVLHYKPSKTETGFVPDWYTRKTKKWIVYPWEINEDRGKLSRVKRVKPKPRLQEVPPGFIHSHLSPVLMTDWPRQRRLKNIAA